MHEVAERLVLGAVEPTAGPDTPTGCDRGDFARLVHTVTDGIAVQAASGHPHAELRRVAVLALRTLFP